ncbi:hypothetical protein [Rhizobium leguminosarum]|uniref:hypothetical protein n=1 Tax=Rhizobium leguminosarum TaxID=384 RepID=UPI000B92B4F3|nr:hypothetical protein [Rhizobium leguminosarum]ASS55895.1 hypothetical protein CHR56_15715 [Rhizobium leguminosarum bv. viciae]
MNTFDDFWREYPRKVSRKDAMRAWEKAIKVELPAVIIASLRRQIPYLSSRPVEFRPHAATWLNGWRWEDEVQAPEAQKQTAYQQRHQNAIDVFDRKLGLKANDEFTGNTLDLAAGDYRPH